MDAGISSQLYKLQERIFKSFRKRSRDSPFMIGDDRATRKQSLIMTKAISYLKKSSLRGGQHPSRHGHESTRGDAFWLWNYLTVIIFEEDCKKATKLWVLLKNSDFFRMQAWKRKQSKNSKGSLEHMPVKENSQDEWLLSDSWPIYRLANGH